jgi:peroxiredoxin
MTRFAGLVAGVFLFGANSFAISAELKIGASMPEWKSLPGTDGKEHSSADLAGKKAIAVIFFDNRCPDCQNYSDRIQAIAKDYKEKGVATVLISVSREEENNLEHMKKLAQTKNFASAYILDLSQKTGKAYGATTTPEVFIFDSERKLVYHGAVDDHWKPESVKREHLRLALDQTLGGMKVETPETKPEGCPIEYEE